MFRRSNKHKDISKHSVLRETIQPEVRFSGKILLFDLMDEQTARILATTLQLAIENFEPRAKVEDIICRPNFEQNSYDIQILFFVVGVREQQNLELVLERLR